MVCFGFVCAYVCMCEWVSESKIDVEIEVKGRREGERKCVCMYVCWGFGKV